MFKAIAKWYNSLTSRDVKEEIRLRIEEYEEQKIKSGDWRVTLPTVIELLELIQPLDLPKDMDKLIEVEVNTGFKNANHVINWCTLLNTTIKSLELSPTEITGVPFNRSSKTLLTFLTGSEKKVIDSNNFKVVLLSHLKEINTELNTISDKRYQAKIEANISVALRDLFAIVEALIVLGVLK